MNRRVVLKQLAALTVLAGSGRMALAQSEARPTFRTLAKPVATDATNQIEVLTFFHYGCPYCRKFEPVLETWLKDLPEDVAYRTVPVIWNNPALANLARLHYALASLPEHSKYSEATFAAVQDSKVRFESEEVVRDWAARQAGLDVEALMKAYNSFGVKAALERSEQLARSYMVEGVPMMAVGGQYTTSPSMTGGYETTLKVVDELLGKIRAGAN